MGDIGVTTNATAEANGHEVPQGKKQILLNAFDMSTVGHLSPGQWKVSIHLPPLYNLQQKLTQHRTPKTNLRRSAS